jgi:hypothetical protein
MAKRAIDLSVEELAATGAKAARTAARDARQAGLAVTGTVTTHDGGQVTTLLAQLLPSGTVTLVRNAGETAAEKAAPAPQPGLDTAAD